MNRESKLHWRLENPGKGNKIFLFVIICTLSFLFESCINISNEELSISKASITAINSHEESMEILFDYVIDNKIYKGKIENTIYDDYGMSIDDRADIRLLDLDGDNKNEIIIKVKSLGNNLSDKCGDLHVIKADENGYIEILHQGFDWNTPDGNLLASMIIQDNRLYYTTGEREIINGENVIKTKLYQLYFYEGKPVSLEANLNEEKDYTEW